MKYLCDRNGKKVAYLDDDGKSIHTLNGDYVAFLDDDAIYSTRGRGSYLGSLEDGLVLDQSGHVVLFIEGADDPSSWPSLAWSTSSGSNSFPSESASKIASNRA